MTQSNLKTESLADLRQQKLRRVILSQSQRGVCVGAAPCYTIPQEEGEYLMACMENDYEAELIEVKYVSKGNTVELYATIDGLLNPLYDWHNCLTDIKWRKLG